MADVAAWLSPYRAVLASRMRAQRAYRLSFAADLASSTLVSVVEFAEVWVVFHSVTLLGGLDLGAMLLLFGLANTAFATAGVLVGHLDTVNTYVRLGTLDAFYLRPQPVLLQLVVSDVSLRKLSRALVGAVVLGVGLVVNDIDWSPANLALLVISFGSGVAIFTGIYVWAAALQFFLLDGAEMTNSFTYGGSYAAQQPTAVFPDSMRLVYGFILPVASVGYLPTIALLDKPGPTWLAWLGPVAALWVWLVGLWLWRQGLRHYQSGGG